MQFTSEELAILQYLQNASLAAAEQRDDFVVTRSWLNTHKSLTKFWKPKQLAAIGVELPPRRGWLAKVEGTTISQKSLAIFESFSR